jgi:tRNA modification GTPase
MTKSTPFDTIAAISTPPGEGGIGIVKISGEKSFEIVKKIFHPQRKKNLSPEMKSFSMLLGYIKGENGIIDEVLVSRMKSPHTYTRENIVEINCHGGAAPLNEVLRTVLSSGARLAEPGEFTKRAFINGRIDLSQAEAVLDIIRSKTNRALDAAVRQLRGEISEKIQSMVDSLKNVLVVLEANIDFPEEEDVSHVQFMKIMQTITSLKTDLETLIRSYDRGKIFRDGVLTVISGKPNVGKSSILNAFLKFDRSIVTHLPGTTRDIIEEQLNLNGIPFILADTAGITDTENIIEMEGVKRSEGHIEKSQLVLLVFDGSCTLDQRDIEIARRVQPKRHIAIINKTDLKMELTPQDLLQKTGVNPDIVHLSAKTGSGLKELEKKMTETVISGSAGGDYSIMVTNSRHFDILQKALVEINHALKTLDESPEAELLAYDVRSAMDILGEITGEVTNREILDVIFNNFCIGK